MKCEKNNRQQLNDYAPFVFEAINATAATQISFQRVLYYTIIVNNNYWYYFKSAESRVVRQRRLYHLQYRQRWCRECIIRTPAPADGWRAVDKRADSSARGLRHV